MDSIYFRLTVRNQKREKGFPVTVPEEAIVKKCPAWWYFFWGNGKKKR
jgi:hypothetical protein